MRFKRNVGWRLLDFARENQIASVCHHPIGGRTLDETALYGPQ